MSPKWQAELAGAVNEGMSGVERLADASIRNNEVVRSLQGDCNDEENSRKINLMPAHLLQILRLRPTCSH